MKSLLEKLKEIEVPRDEKIQNVMLSLWELESLRLKQLELQKELAIALICEKSDALYLTIVVDSKNGRHYFEHNEPFCPSDRDILRNGFKKVETYKTRKHQNQKQ